MTNDRAELPVGTVDRTLAHFELLLGDASGDAGPNEWTVVARLGGTDFAPIVEIEPGVSDRLRSRIEQMIERALRDDEGECSTYVGVIGPDGFPHRSWTASLARRAGSTANWYGDLHWRGRRDAEAGAQGA